ncbi:DUF4189 domain-containing protein [Sediminimonas sp.]|uniref:DUF4189 domain-containing protein n=1 Tax=Sediminimonas sp. TaxID=2823379 RepID=UPI0025DD1D18|nr:DUF4189 domain-containing protein [Sediminimonas sp.]
MRFSWIAGAALTLILGAAQAQAGQCGYKYCWGAVGFGPGGAWGYAHGQRSAQQAHDVAQNGCGWACTEMRTFYNACAAIAVADNGAWGWATEKNRELAESSAMNYCMDNGFNCRVRVWSCSR